MPILLMAGKENYPGEGEGRSSSWQPRGPSVKMFKIMRHLCTGASATFLQGRE